MLGLNHKLLDLRTVEVGDADRSSQVGLQCGSRMWIGCGGRVRVGACGIRRHSSGTEVGNPLFVLGLEGLASGKGDRTNPGLR